MLMLPCLPVTAVEEMGFQLGGFGTLGLTYNDSDDFAFVRDSFQPDGIKNEVSTKTDSTLGIQARYRFTPHLDAVVQLLSRHDADGSFPPEVNWAYLKYTPTPDWDLRAGRLSWDVYMLSDSRYVGYSFLWVRPPIEYFGVQQLSHIDGFDVTWTRPLDSGLFWIKAYGGFADEELPIEDAQDYDLGGSYVVGAHANYQFGDWWLRLGFAREALDEAADDLQPLFERMATAGGETGAELADDMRLAGADVDHFVVGLLYSRGPLRLQFMFDHSDSDTLLFTDFYTGYATVSYRVGDWTPFLSFAAIESDRIDRESGFPSGSPDDAAIQAFLRDVRYDQHTTSLGVRRDITENVALKFQVDRLWAKSPAVTMMRDPAPDWDGRGTVVTATLDFVF
ncbi:hypothetical protein PC39_13337 [Salinisphaera sp. PC39]